MVRLWDSETGAGLHALKGHAAAVWSVAFSPDGRLIVSASLDQTVRLWDSATGALRHTLKGHIGGVREVTFSPDGRLVASASLDYTVRLWDSATGAVRHTLASGRPSGTATTMMVTATIRMSRNSWPLTAGEAEFSDRFARNRIKRMMNRSPAALDADQHEKIRGRSGIEITYAEPSPPIQSARPASLT
jgi:WD40 repeat protein